VTPMKSSQTEPIEEEWGDWRCPVCDVEESDPASIYATTCRNNHMVLLGAVEHGERRAFLDNESKEIPK
jgi:hypothetical protein